MLVQQRGSCQVKVGSTVGKYHICAGTGLCFELGYKLGNRLMIRFLGWGVGVNYGHPPARCARVPLRFAKGGHVVAVMGMVVWVVGPLGRPVALTLGPPLNLPLGGGGEWLAGEGTCCCGRGYCGDGGVGGTGRCGEVRASPACCARVPFALRRGGVRAVREPPLRVGRRERVRVRARGWAGCFVFLWVPASAGMTEGLRE